MENARIQLKWLDFHLKDKELSNIDRSLLQEIAVKKEREKVAPATVNRMLEIVRAILNKALVNGNRLKKHLKFQFATKEMNTSVS